MTKKISDILQNSPKTPPLKPWPTEGPKKAPVKKTAKTPVVKGQNTQFRLIVYFKPEFMQMKNGKPTQQWFWNGLYLLEKFELAYNQYFPGGELQAIWFKLRQIRGRMDRMVIFDKRKERESDIAAEWINGVGVVYNRTNRNWKEVCE